MPTVRMGYIPIRTIWIALSCQIFLQRSADSGGRVLQGLLATCKTKRFVVYITNLDLIDDFGPAWLIKMREPADSTIRACL
jgi:hypothetical protein